MSEENMNIEPEVNTEVEDTEVQEEIKVEAPVESTVDDSEKLRQDQLNFKAMREAKRQAELERDELVAKLKQFEAAKKVEPEDDDIYDDDISKTRKELNELKSQWAAQQNQARIMQIEQKLKNDFPDLEKVVNDETIEVLRTRDKEFAKIIDTAPQSTDELYNRALSAYTLIKKYGIYVEDKHKADRDRVEKNLSKPRPVSTASSSPSEGLADFAGFAGLNDEDRQKAIYQLARERAGMS